MVKTTLEGWKPNSTVLSIMFQFLRFESKLQHFMKTFPQTFKFSTTTKMVLLPHLPLLLLDFRCSQPLSGGPLWCCPSGGVAPAASAECCGRRRWGRRSPASARRRRPSGGSDGRAGRPPASFSSPPPASPSRTSCGSSGPATRYLI